LWLQRAPSTPPPAQPFGGEGERGCYLYGHEDLLNKNVSYTQIIIKRLLKMTFLMKTSETKILVKIVCKAFLIFKKYFA
jgi:hypothetical protein